ncbi:MAG: bifunctional nuclease family protein [Bacteroidales bacterium]|nr:bifunctional nuclease family protein [Bacteroidales bacterium]
MRYTPVYPVQIKQTMSDSDSYILVLDAPEMGKHVPVLIGESEAQAIVLAIEQHKTSRPLTHNLICNIMKEYQLGLKQVSIDRFDEGIFYSSLLIDDGFSERHIDSRTSDAVVLSILQHCEILMSMQVLEETSMEPGALEDNLPEHSDSDFADEAIRMLEEQLRQCEEAEDYEQAAEIMNRINAIRDINDDTIDDINE